MRIVCLSNMYPGPGNPDYGSFVRDMCDALQARGHAVDRVVIDTRDSGALRTPAKYADLMRRGLRAARGADVVYAHYMFPTGAVAAAMHRRTGVPWVVTAHGGDVRNLARPRVLRGTRAVVASSAAIIAVSRYLADRMREAGLHHPRVRIANMGVDLQRFTPADRGAARELLGVPRDVPLVLAVGGLTERKDPLGLLQAVARLRATRPDVHVALVGDGPLAAAVRHGARHLGIPGTHLHTPGALPHDRVAGWMAAADVLSMVSRVEPLGVVALEALASGRPVVATSEGGAREVVPSHGAGRITAPGRPDLLAAALADVLDHPPQPATCRAAAVGHSLQRQAARVEAVLAEAAAVGTRP